MSTPAYIRLDLVPATVIVTDGDGEEIDRTDKARAIVTDSEVLIYQDGDQGRPAVWREWQLDDFSGDNKIGYTAETSDGETLHISRNSWCVCGSRLRGFRPFPGVPYQPQG